MTRIKKGLDYFCFTTDYFTDLKVKRLRRLCGNNGLLVCIYLVNEAYRVVGYALKVCEELILDIAENFRIEEVEVQNIIDACCKVGIFDAGIYRKCEVLTSAEIQERFVATCRKLGRRNVEIVKDLLLIEDKFVLPSEASQPSVNQTYKKSDEDGDIVKSENETAEICPQRKEKKGKVRCRTALACRALYRVNTTKPSSSYAPLQRLSASGTSAWMRYFVFCLDRGMAMLTLPLSSVVPSMPSITTRQWATGR